jgi:hypothetical protein
MFHKFCGMFLIPNHYLLSESVIKAQYTLIFNTWEGSVLVSLQKFEMWNKRGINSCLFEEQAVTLTPEHYQNIRKIKDLSFKVNNMFRTTSRKLHVMFRWSNHLNKPKTQSEVDKLVSLNIT